MIETRYHVIKDTSEMMRDYLNNQSSYLTDVTPELTKTQAILNALEADYGNAGTVILVKGLYDPLDNIFDIDTLIGMWKLPLPNDLLTTHRIICTGDKPL